jgi:hypothetical protein
MYGQALPPRLAKLMPLIILLSVAHNEKALVGFFLITQSFDLSRVDKIIISI